MTRQEAIEKARADYQSALGTIIEIDNKLGITGYADDNSIDVYPAPGQTFKVRVLRTSGEDLAHTTDNWLDPYWNVEPVERYPELAELSSLWTFGPAYQFED